MGRYGTDGLILLHSWIDPRSGQDGHDMAHTENS